MEPVEVSVAIDVITVRSRGDELASDNPNPYLWIFFFKKDRYGLFVRPVAGRSGSHKNVTDFDLVAPTTQRVSDSLGTFTTSLWPLDPDGNDGESVVGVFGALLEQDSTQDQSILEEYLSTFGAVSSILAGWAPPDPLPTSALRSAIELGFQRAIDHTVLFLDRDDLIDVFFHSKTYSDLAATFWGELSRPFDFSSHGGWSLSTRIGVRPLVGLGNSAVFESRTGIDIPLARTKYPNVIPAIPDTSTRVVMDALHLIETKAPSLPGPSGFHAGDLLTHFRDDSLVTPTLPNGRWEPGLPFTWVDATGASPIARNPALRREPYIPFQQAFRWPCWVEARPGVVHGIAVQGEETGAQVCYFYGSWGMSSGSPLSLGVRDATGLQTFGIWVPYQTPSPILGASDCRGAPALGRVVKSADNSLIVLVPARRGGIDVYSSPDPAFNQNLLVFYGGLGLAGDGTRLISDTGGLVQPTPHGEVLLNQFWPAAAPDRPLWNLGPHFGSNVVDAVRVVQSDFDAIEVLASEQTAGGRRLATYILDVLDPTQNRWSELATLPGSEGVTGIPGFIQSNYGREFPSGHGNFEVIAPGPGNQLLFWWCNTNLGRMWNGPFPISWDNIPYSIKAVHLIQLHRRGNQSRQDDFLMILETGRVGMEPAPYGAGQMFWSRRNNTPEPGPWSFPEPITGWSRVDL